jgi:hypothetical protein
MRRWLFIGLLAIGLAACGSRPLATGTLHGSVSIGPLTPVQRESEPPATVSPQVYTSRGLIVSSETGTREIVRVQFDADGTYRLTLPAGRYRVDLQPTGIDRAEALPTVVEIKAGEVTRLDVNIDTGIR